MLCSEPPFPIFTTNKEDNFTIETNYTLINIAMKLVRGKDASTLNFVLGSSSADDIRKGFLNHSRDVGIQYPGNEFPILLHATVIERPSECTNHDVYHAIKQSYTHKKNQRVL